MTEAAGRTVAGMTGRHRLHNPDWVEFLLNVLRGVLDYSFTFIKLVGNINNSIARGLKEITLN